MRPREGRERKEQIESALESLTQPGSRLRIAGGVAIQELESWIIALAGRSRTETMGEAQRQHALEELEVESKSTEDMVRIVESSNLERIPEDAKSLREWMERARRALEVSQS